MLCQILNVDNNIYKINKKTNTQEFSMAELNNTPHEFTVTTTELKEITALYTRRKVLCEEVDFLQTKEGVHWLISGIKCDTEMGLKQSEIEQRRVVFGDNRKIEKKPATFWSLWYEALNDFTLIVLMISGLVSIIIDMVTSDNKHRATGWLQGFAIEMAVFISSFIQALNNYQKDKQFRVLNDEAEKSKRVTIKRDGKEEEFKLSEVVVGDLVKITSGMEVAGDGVCLISNEVQADESAMTGETLPMHKEPFHKCLEEKIKIENTGRVLSSTMHDVPSYVIMAGTKISKGTGWMVVINVGKNSAIGAIQDLVATDDDETPLESKLTHLAELIGKFGLFMAVITFIVLLIRWIIDIATNGWTSTHGQDIVKYVIIAITILVVAIPEGLPLAVTLSLALSVKKMMKDGNLVRKMHACETMGGANVICSDKTGTLTQNDMKLTRYWNIKEEIVYDISTEKYKPWSQYIPKNCHTPFLDVAAVCSVDDTAVKGGSATELAILKYLEASQVDYRELRHKKTLHKLIPFTSDRKRMSVVIDCEESSTGRRIYTKGASEYILQSCSDFYNFETDGIIPLDASLRKKAETAINEMANGSLRTIGLSYKDISPSADLDAMVESDVRKEETYGYTLIGIIGIMDPLRKGVKKAVRRCHKASVDVKMVTGDNFITARAIAKDCGIIENEEMAKEEGRVMLGEDFIKAVGGVVCKNHKNDMKNCNCVRNKEEQKKPENKGKLIREDTILYGDVFDKIYPKLRVLARSKPADKYCMVVGLKERNHVVAVTGDGTNDAPALKKANIGFAMGIAGTEVAKEAALIILTGDDFPSIVKAILWGRNIYEAIRKFLQFQLTVNVVAVVSVFISAAYFSESLLSSIQLLWVNLIMDTLASLALTSEPPEKRLLKQKPQSKTENIINKHMIKHIAIQSIYQLAVLLVCVWTGRYWIPEQIKKHQGVDEDGYFNGFIHPGTKLEDWDPQYQGYSRMFTFLFNTFVFMTIFDFVNARKLHEELNVFGGIHKSQIFILMMIVITILQIIIVTLTSYAFQICQWGLGLWEWMISVGFGVLTLLITLLGKVLIPDWCICEKKEAKHKKDELFEPEIPPPASEKHGEHHENESRHSERKKSVLSLKKGDSYQKRHSSREIRTQEFFSDDFYLLLLLFFFKQFAFLWL